MKQRHRWAIVLLTIILFAGAARSGYGQLIDLTGHWSAPIIAALQAKGIVSGDTQGRFQPDDALTRAEMSRMLVSALGNDAEANLLAAYPSRFADVAEAHWARGYIESLAESAVTQGIGDGRFGPEDTVNRAQMAAFLIRAAGLVDLAERLRLEPSGYMDDLQIESWARGPVNLAREIGLMRGFADGSFRPLQPITRAEGSTALMRLLGFQGSAYHLTGTLLSLNPESRQGLLRDHQGREHSFVMDRDARYYSGGIAVLAERLRRLDQVWIVLGPAGQGLFLDARYTDLLVREATVEGTLLRTTDAEDNVRQLLIQPGALLHLNGRPSTLQAMGGSLARAYMALDQITGEIRVLDGVRPSVQGIFSAYSSDQRRLVFREGSEIHNLILSPAAQVYLNARSVEPTELSLGDRLMLVVDDENLVTYLHAER